ncbi:AraC family transcriptional regulator [Bradyrhizobium sp. ARR65]|uniref:helix-turn-helix domain-containing protein n=1 Tax=Bradyrhizobium sp. ARR65 TaxID=1040989 RepID=UPI0004667CCD|nr:AraC family transcriptional regulator [Bradyrhizobium sp. ARR65]
MLLHSQLLQGVQDDIAGRVATGAMPGFPSGFLGGESVALLLNDRAGSALLSREGLAAESGIILAFQRLQIVLAGAQAESDKRPASNMSSGTADIRSQIAARRVGSALQSLPTRSASKEMTDPVIRRLSDALAAAEDAADQHSTIYADAVRLAIAIRLLGRQCETRPSAPDIGSVEPECGARQVRALQKWRLKRIIEYVDNHLSSKISLVDLAAVAGLSRMHFASQFRAATGLRPHEYVLRRRIHRAEELLLRSTMPIVEIALTVGFQTQAHFTTVFKRFVGHTPYQWRNANRADSLAAM